MAALHGDRLHHVTHVWCKPNHRGEYDVTLTTDETAFRFRLNWGELLMLLESLHQGVTEETAIQRERNRQRAQRKFQLLTAKEADHG